MAVEVTLEEDEREAPEGLDRRPAHRVRRRRRSDPRPGVATRRRAVTAVVVALAAVAAVPLSLRAVAAASSNTFAGELGPTSQVSLDFVYTAPLASILVRPGQLVRRGQVVATQVAAPEALAVSNDLSILGADRAELVGLQHTLAGIGGPVSSPGVALESQIGTLQSQIARDLANLATDRERESADTLTSPVSGLVVGTAGAPGDLAGSTGVRLYQAVGADVGSSSSIQLFPASAGAASSSAGGQGYAPVVTIDEWPRLQVTARVSEGAIGSIYLGERARFRLNSLGGLDLVCEVDHIVPGALSTSGSISYDVVLRVRSKLTKRALPGMTGSVVFQPRS